MADQLACAGRRPPPPPMSRIPTFGFSKIPTGSTTPVSATPPAASPALSPMASPRQGPSPCSSSNNLLNVGRAQFTFSSQSPTPHNMSASQEGLTGFYTPQQRPSGGLASMFATPGNGHAPPLLSFDSPISSPVSPQPLAKQQAVEWDGILVAVRVRPLSEKERNKSEREVWTVEDNCVTGTVPHVRGPVKYHYDTVFDPSSRNEQVYNAIGRNMVPVALTGFNATIFAYGVTSSGKTHTIMGSPSEAGIIPRVIRDVFAHIENMPSKQFLMRLSIMEIYNEVINDLLDVTRVNLKIREDGQKQVQVEGLTEEVVVNAEQALALIAMGDANRKVSATAFNEDSSRSHTVCRLAIESAEKAQSGKGCLSYFNIIDLAGSESAKAAKSVGHRLEGSYINKSLLTLGTVIHKLADSRNDTHIPFRDSKLTRLLQPSLSGTGAKVAIVCNITPSSGQLDETHNTLKFASRAKMVRIQVSKNEIVDAQSMIKRLQEEIASLKEQLSQFQTMNMHGSASVLVGNPDAATRNSAVDLARLEVEMQSRLLEERQKQEAEQAVLHGRLQRLMGLLLSSSKALAASSGPIIIDRKRPKLQRSYSAELPVNSPDLLTSSPQRDRHATFHTGPFDSRGNAEATGEGVGAHDGTDEADFMPSVLNLRNPGWANGSPSSKSGSEPFISIGVRSNPYPSSPLSLHMFGAGDLHTGTASSLLRQTDDMEKQILKEQLQVLATEFEEKHREVEKLRNANLHSGSSNADVELQVMYADREMLQDQLCATEITNEKLMRELEDSNSEVQKLQRRVDQLEAANQKLRTQSQEAAVAQSQALAEHPESDEKLREETEQLRAQLAQLQQRLAARTPPASERATNHASPDEGSGPVDEAAMQVPAPIVTRLSLGSWRAGNRATSEDRESEEDVLNRLRYLEDQVSDTLQEIAKRDAQMKAVLKERDFRTSERDANAQKVENLSAQLEEAAVQLSIREQRIHQLEEELAANSPTATAAPIIAAQSAHFDQELLDRDARIQQLQEQLEQLQAEKEAEVEKLQETVRKLEQKEALHQQLESFKRRVEARSRRTSSDGSLSFTSPEKAQTKLLAELHSEVAALKASNKRLHGYELDQLTPEELVNLIGSLTQAVERVRVTVQARRNNPPHPPPSPFSCIPAPTHNSYSGIPSPPPVQASDRF